MREQLLIGFGRQNFTPQGPVHIQGGSWRQRVSEGVLDPLLTTCIAVTVGKTTVLLYTTDNKVATKNITDPAKAAICEATGIPAENIFITATHTHSSVAIRYTWDGVEDCRTLFSKACADAAVEALNNRTPARIFSGGAQTEGLTFVRHYRMNDGTVAGPNFGSFESGVLCHTREADNQLQIVKFAREGKKDVLLLSFPCHGTFQGNTKMLSADWPAPAREYLEQQSDCLAAVFQGACGDQTPGSRVHNPCMDYRVHGQKLAEYALAALPHLKELPAGQIRRSDWLVSFPTNKKNMDKLPKALKALDIREQFGINSQELKDYLKKNGLASRHEANWLRIRSREGEYTDLDLHVLTVGGLAFALAPYEMFGRQGKYIKEHSPFENTVIITCLDGCYNYIADKESFDYDCYESQCSYFARGVAEQAAKNYVTMLEQLKEHEQKAGG